MRILGIDPGLGIVGYGLIEIASDESGRYRTVAREWGTIRTPAGRPDGERLKEIYADITELLQRMQPDCISLERIYFFRNVTTMVPVCQARGVLMLAFAQADLPVAEYTPMQVKQAITGYGKAQKAEIQSMVARWLNLAAIPRPDDAADALAMALCHVQFMGIHGLKPTDTSNYIEVGAG